MRIKLKTFPFHLNIGFAIKLLQSLLKPPFAYVAERAHHVRPNLYFHDANLPTVVFKGVSAK
jgi:hypothetical protein